MEYKDKFSRPLEPGDTVVIVGDSKELELGKITKLTPKKIRVELYDKLDWHGRPVSALRWPPDVLKIPVSENDVILHTLKS